MKIFNVLGVLLSGLLIWVAYYFASLVSSAKLDYMFSDIFGDSYSINRAPGLSNEAAVTIMMFLVFFVILLLLNRKKIATKTAKLTSLIGLILTAIFIAWDAMVLADPGGISFDEVGLGFMGYGVVMIVLCLISLLQASKAK